MPNVHGSRQRSSVAAFTAPLLLFAAAGWLFGQSADHRLVSQPLAAGSSRPASVPDGYVITPFGYFHRSCVQTLAEGETLLGDGRVQHADGSVTGNARVCNYPRYGRDGKSLPARSAQAARPEVNGWMENANVAANSPDESYSALLALWKVPPSPEADDGQVLYYFPGLEDIDNTQSILQPVLQWAGGQWGVANWNCCLNNITVESQLISVRPGDPIAGLITADCPPGTLSCPSWTIFSLDLRSGAATTLKDTPSEGQIFNWAFGGVMEPYYVVACDDYPPNRDILFDVQLFDKNLQPVRDPKWSQAVNTTDTPQCGYGVRSSAWQVQLSY